MSDNYQFDLALTAYMEVLQEMGLNQHAGQKTLTEMAEPVIAAPDFPSDAILFGVAEDGVPLYLHLRDPRPGPVLVVGEQGCGKTDFLKTIVQSARQKSPLGIRSVVLSGHPEDYDDLDGLPGFSGSWSVSTPAGADLLNQLAAQVQQPDGGSPILFLLDGLESVMQMSQAALDDLTYVLTCGPRSLVWPLVSVNSESALALSDWLGFFRTRVYGRITNPRANEILTSHPGANLNDLIPGAQFCLRQSSKWLKFWLPG